MRVYVLSRYEFDDHDIVDVFSSLEKAEARVPAVWGLASEGWEAGDGAVWESTPKDEPDATYIITAWDIV